MATVAELQTVAPEEQAVQTLDNEKYPVAQVVATVAEVHYKAPVAQATAAPAEMKYPGALVNP